MTLNHTYRCEKHGISTDSLAVIRSHIDREHPGGAMKPAPGDFLTDRYESCMECGHPVDTEEPGVWKSTNDEQWWHPECYDKIERVEVLAKKIRTLLVPEGTHDGYSDEFHNRLDNAQAELQDAVDRERLRQDQDLVTDGGTTNTDHRWCDECEAETFHYGRPDGPDGQMVYRCQNCRVEFELAVFGDGAAEVG